MPPPVRTRSRYLLPSLHVAYSCSLFVIQNGCKQAGTVTPTIMQILTPVFCVCLFLTMYFRYPQVIFQFVCEYQPERSVIFEYILTLLVMHKNHVFLIPLYGFQFASRFCLLLSINVGTIFCCSSSFIVIPDSTYLKTDFQDSPLVSSCK